MHLLLITNLYPPQELGGYGRSMADFAWGLIQNGHRVQVLTSDAPYLGASSDGPSGESVARGLLLKGSFEGQLTIERNPATCAAIDQHNQRTLASWLAAGPWDGALVGNLDLLGPELLAPLVAANLPVAHHIGFVAPPFAPNQLPNSGLYTLVAASQAVRSSLVGAGLPVAQAPVVYPGARVDLFGADATGRALPAPLAGGARPGPLGSRNHPLRVCFAGLLMGSKGAHTLVQALILLHQRGFHLQAHLAGGNFQAGYREQLAQLLQQAGLDGLVTFVGQLTRAQLARFFCLHHVCVFPSIYPEAFGIVGAEAMASGLALVSSGVGGAGELFEDGHSGLRFEAGNSAHLAEVLARLMLDPALLQRIAQTGQQRARALFSVEHSARQLGALFSAAKPLDQGGELRQRLALIPGQGSLPGGGCQAAAQLPIVQQQQHPLGEG